MLARTVVVDVGSTAGVIVNATVDVPPVRFGYDTSKHGPHVMPRRVIPVTYHVPSMLIALTVSPG